MSHRHHVPQTKGVMHDIKVFSPYELSSQYGIEIDETNKSIWDPVEGKKFRDILDWASYIAEQESDNAYDHHFVKVGHKHMFDD